MLINVDPQEYLPIATFHWCQEILTHLNETKSDLEADFPLLSCTNHHKYLELKKAVNDHMISGREPLLDECSAPVGGYRWQPAHNDEDVRTRSTEGLDISGEGPEDIEEGSDLAITF